MFLGNQVSSLDKTMVTLILNSTKELLHEGWGSPHPPHKVVVAAPHQVGGSMKCRRATNTPRGWRTEIFFWFTKEPQNKVTKRCSLTL